MAADDARLSRRQRYGRAGRPIRLQLGTVSLRRGDDRDPIPFPLPRPPLPCARPRPSEPALWFYLDRTLDDVFELDAPVIEESGD